MLALGKLLDQNLQRLDHVRPVFLFEVQKGQQTPLLLFHCGSTLFRDLDTQPHLVNGFVVLFHLVVDGCHKEARSRRGVQRLGNPDFHVS